MTLQTRFAEIRADGNSLAGTVIRYGDEYIMRGNDYELIERIEPGAFGDLENQDLILNMQHMRDQPLARTNGGGLELTDSAESLEMRAENNDPDFIRALAKVRGGLMRGLSVEFVPNKGGDVVRSVGDRIVRTVKSATLKAIGLVDTPAYPMSTVEARALVDEMCQKVSRNRNMTHRHRLLYLV